MKPVFAALVLVATFAFFDTVLAASRQQDKDAYIKQLEILLAKCTSRGDNAITIGDEIWFCGAAPSGLKAK